MRFSLIDWYKKWGARQAMDSIKIHSGKGVAGNHKEQTHKDAHYL